MIKQQNARAGKKNNTAKCQPIQVLEDTKRLKFVKKAIVPKYHKQT